MNIPVLVERVAANGYRARSGEPLVMTAEGETAAEAVEKLEFSIRQRMTGGSQMYQINISSVDPPWKALRGILRDDPMYDEWREAMEEYRRQVDQGPNVHCWYIRE